MTLTTDEIKSVYQQLRDRKINPAGTFDSGGRFYAKNSDLINVRSPSRAWPFSELVACRTLKYVKAVADKFKCETISELINHV